MCDIWEYEMMHHWNEKWIYIFFFGKYVGDLHIYDYAMAKTFWGIQKWRIIAMQPIFENETRASVEILDAYVVGDDIICIVLDCLWCYCKYI